MHRHSENLVTLVADPASSSALAILSLCTKLLDLTHSCSDRR